MIDRTEKTNPLASAPVLKLMVKFAVPSIIAMLVGALYNIVDQIFIGRAVGPLGNAATNIAFPLSTMCLSLSLMFGIGGASSFNLAMGGGKKDDAPYYAGNSAAMLAICGIVLSMITLLFLTPILTLFGASENILPYAVEYVRVTAVGFPFLILTSGGGHLIRADGSPRMTMICNLTGAVVNTILDAIFVFGFGWGMTGAAVATVIGQACSAAIVIAYITHYKTVRLEKRHFIIKKKYTLRAASIGTASFINQLAMMIVMIVINNSLAHYGALSSYGADIPIACAGIVMKVNQVIFSIVIGIAQGTQPIVSFNYGAKNYGRVREAYRYAIIASVLISTLAFIAFQTVPDKILAMFGKGSKEYFEFGTRYFRIFLFFIWLTVLQLITSTFFTSIGKPIRGIILSLTRQIIFFLPLLLILPRFFGIDGILYTGPVSDLISAIAAVVMARTEFKRIDSLEEDNG